MNSIGIRDLHDLIMFYLLLVFSFVFYLLFVCLKSYPYRYSILNTKLELIWTIIPGIIILLIGLPSIQLLYFLESLNSPLITLEIKGFQWAWKYIFKDFNIEFDSYSKDSSSFHSFRLFSVDNKLVLPVNLPIRLIVSSDDVIHSWTIPNIGIKLDSNPGRLNSSILFLLKSGLFFGQCSELCGLLHSKMSIELFSTSLDNWFLWLFTLYNFNFSLFSSFLNEL